MAEHIQIVEEPKPVKPTTGSSGQRTQVPGCMTSVSAVAQHSGGIGTGFIIKRDK